MKEMKTVELIDAIQHQQHIVNDCSELAQIKTERPADDHREHCHGLYYALLRMEQLTAELINRTSTN